MSNLEENSNLSTEPFIVSKTSNENPTVESKETSNILRLAIEIPEWIAGNVIGKRQKDLIYVSNVCRVRIKPRKLGPTSFLMASGTVKEDVERAIRLINNKVCNFCPGFYDSDYRELSFNVPRERCKYVIGTRAKRLNLMRQDFGTYCIVEDTTEELRTCTIRGKIEDIMKAKEWVLDLIYKPPLCPEGILYRRNLVCNIKTVEELQEQEKLPRRFDFRRFIIPETINGWQLACGKWQTQLLNWLSTTSTKEPEINYKAEWVKYFRKIGENRNADSLELAIKLDL